jgi:predicted small secreted protein
MKKTKLLFVIFVCLAFAILLCSCVGAQGEQGPQGE